MIEPGQTLKLHYPSCTHVLDFSCAPRLPRVLTVRRIRDLVTEPLTLQEFLHRPYIVRSRWLAIGWDIEKRVWRQFYLGSSDEYQAIGQLRFAVYHPRRLLPSRVVSQGFDATIDDRELMLRVLKRWQEKGRPTYNLRVCCDDMRLFAT